MRLTSAAVPDEKDDTTVVIGPPFYLSAKFAGRELPIQVCNAPVEPSPVRCSYAVLSFTRKSQKPLSLQACNAVLGGLTATS